MACQQLRTCFDDIWELHFQRLGYSSMKRLSLALYQGIVESVLQQRVLEHICASRRTSFLMQDLRVYQFCQFRLQLMLVKCCNCSQQIVAELTTERSGELGQLAIALQSFEPRHHQILKGRRN